MKKCNTCEMGGKGQSVEVSHLHNFVEIKTFHNFFFFCHIIIATVLDMEVNCHLVETHIFYFTTPKNPKTVI